MAWTPAEKRERRLETKRLRACLAAGVWCYCIVQIGSKCYADQTFIVASEGGLNTIGADNYKLNFSKSSSTISSSSGNGSGSASGATEFSLNDSITSVTTNKQTGGVNVQAKLSAKGFNETDASKLSSSEISAEVSTIGKVSQNGVEGTGGSGSTNPSDSTATDATPVITTYSAETQTIIIRTASSSSPGFIDSFAQSLFQ